ncbi:MAG: hypothetical protein AAGA16_07560 [Cyanobacteria bacterium P01_E01_bin.35]
MGGAVFAVGFLSQHSLIHEKLLKSKDLFGRGVYIISMYSSWEKKLKDEVSLLFAQLSEFEINNSFNAAAIRNNAVAKSIQQYDTSYQYCVMFEIDQNIVGGAFIPFDQPIELQLAIDQAIAAYKNS